MDKAWVLYARQEDKSWRVTGVYANEGLAKATAISWCDAFGWNLNGLDHQGILKFKIEPWDVTTA